MLRKIVLRRQTQTLLLTPVHEFPGLGKFRRAPQLYLCKANKLFIYSNQIDLPESAAITVRRQLVTPGTQPVGHLGLSPSPEKARIVCLFY